LPSIPQRRFLLTNFGAVGDGIVEKITYRDLTMRNVKVAITISLFYFDKAGQKERQMKTVSAATPVVRDVRIVNVSVEGAKTASEIVGLPEMPVNGVLLDNVKINAKTSLTIQDAKGVELRAVEVKPEKGASLTTEHAEVRTEQR
jgi:polygalacturonase